MVSNRGLIGFRPLGYTPGQSIQLFLDGLYPNEPFTLMADTATPLPVYPFPSVVYPYYLLGVIPGTPTFFSVIDGLGVFGPADPLGVTQYLPGVTQPFGGFISAPFTTPNPPSGINMSLQAVYLDATQPFGWRLSWTRFPFTL